MKIFRLAMGLAVFKGYDMAAYSLPFWKVATFLTLVGLSNGLDAGLGRPPWSFVFGLVLWWVWVPLLTVFMRWWLKRGGHWQSEGPLFSLLVATSGVDLAWNLVSYFISPSWSVIVLLPFTAYSILVAGSALKHATGVRVSYAVGGVFLFMLLACLIAFLFAVCVGFVAAAAGLSLPGGQHP